MNYKLFYILILLRGSTSSDDLLKKVDCCLKTLAEKSNHESVDDLYSSHIGEILSNIEDSAIRWQELSPEFVLFLTILKSAG